jgi:hypothetical protein
MQMSSFNSASSPPIILIPTDRSDAINGGTGVIVKEVTQRGEKVSFHDVFSSTLHSLHDEMRTLFTFHPKEWFSAFRRNPKFPLFVVGDIDGFVGLFMNNLATLLAVILGLKIVLEDDIIYGRIVPG